MGLIQASGKQVASGVGSSVTFNAPGNFTVGNWVIITLRATSTFSGASVAGATWTGGDKEEFAFGGKYEAIIHQIVGNSGRSDVVFNFGSGAANQVTCSFEEWDDITAVDQIPAEATGVASVTITSGTTTQADERVYALGLTQSLASGSPTRTLAGYTQVWAENGSTDLGGMAGYKEVAATGAQSATFTDSGNDNVALILVTYKFTRPHLTINSQPQDVVAKIGATATFSTSATASAGSLSYQWQIQQGGSFSDVTGATSNSYTTPTLTAADGAGYRCNVTDPNGTTATSAASLTVARSAKSLRFPATWPQGYDRRSKPLGSDVQGKFLKVFFKDEFFDSGDPVAAAAITEANDTLASGATLAEAAALAVTEAADTLVSVVTAAVAAAASVTEADDTLVSAFTAAGLNADLAVTEENDAVASASTEAIAAAGAVTEAADVLGSAASVAGAAAATITEAADTVASAATVALAAAASIAEAPDSLVSAATEPLAAAATLTEADDILASTATAALIADAAVTEEADTLVASMGTGLGADLAVTEADDEVASASVISTFVSAVLIEVGDLLAASGNAGLIFGASITEDDDELDAAGSVALGADFSVDEDDDLLSSSLLGQYGDIAMAVWNFMMANGKTAEQNTLETRTYVEDLHRIHGLVVAEPLVVTPTLRTAGPIVQTIGEAGGTVTVERTA